ncbi:MAG: hypothetical protein RMY64_04600 [Nostoc sp. DedQUE08]|uniref:hypothetical protein n=1 Tax=Nostoc sp. DedQUE08 TaxID=3075393 RepID=UPI002AD39690|nr:hypothetical protein [Nostoc sp. DedQUE08]MDZ8064911.1 hypothetical protein [Nostoc sp. DedQUE08]
MSFESPSPKIYLLVRTILAPTAIHKGLDARSLQSIEVILLKNGKTMVNPKWGNFYKNPEQQNAQKIST